MKSFEEYLKDNIDKDIIDFQIRANITNNGVTFYIHPSGKDGETLDYIIKENFLFNLNNLDDNDLNIFQEANELLTSTYSIAKREGKDTNWTIFKKRIYDALIKQYPIVQFKPKYISKLTKVNIDN